MHNGLSISALAESHRHLHMLPNPVRQVRTRIPGWTTGRRLEILSVLRLAKMLKAALGDRGQSGIQAVALEQESGSSLPRRTTGQRVAPNRCFLICLTCVLAERAAALHTHQVEQTEHTDRMLQVFQRSPTFFSMLDFQGSQAFRAILLFLVRPALLAHVAEIHMGTRGN